LVRQYGRAIDSPFYIDLALLPINGNDPSRGVAGNLDTKEAPCLGKPLVQEWLSPVIMISSEFNTAANQILLKQEESNSPIV
jgi:hypothetical protein